MNIKYLAIVLISTTIGVASVNALTSETAKEVAMSQKEIAQAVLIGTMTGDLSAIKAYVNPAKYIEHNQMRNNGLQSLVDSLATNKKRGLNISILRTFQDGDYIFIHSLYGYSDIQYVAMDIFMFENGLIVEHWDNFEEIHAPNESGRTQFDGPTLAKDRQNTTANKALIESSINDILMGKHPEKLPLYFEGNNYLQHNYNGGDGLSGMAAAIKRMAEKGLKSTYKKVVLVLGEGDFVLTVSDGLMGTTPVAFYDLFRVENGKIAEHWDIHENITVTAATKDKAAKF